MRRGQAALEYLLTYGWAILIIIIVGASLYALGIFNPGTFAGKRNTGFSTFQVDDHKIDTDANVTIRFGNRAGKTVELGNITVTFKSKECSSDSLDGNTIGPNNFANLTLECAGAWDVDSGLELRSSYSATVDIEYIDPDSSFSHTDVGTLFGAVEKV